jgi:hypothetical protein
MTMGHDNAVYSIGRSVRADGTWLVLHVGSLDSSAGRLAGESDGEPGARERKRRGKTRPMVPVAENCDCFAGRDHIGVIRRAGPGA